MLQPARFRILGNGPGHRQANASQRPPVLGRCPDHTRNPRSPWRHSVPTAAGPPPFRSRTCQPRDRSNAGAKARPPAPHPPGSDIGPIAMGAGLFGLTAIGLVTALDRRRRRQIGRRSFGGHIPRPEPKSPLADLELQLRHYARAGQVFWLCHLAELLGHAADVAGVAPPEVVGVELVDHGLDVLVTGDSADPLAPFARRADRPDVWHLPFTTDPGVVDEAAASSPVPLVLATVGQGAAGAVLVNVDHYRSIHITVSADRVEGILAAMATELAGTTAPSGQQSSPSASATAWSIASKGGSSSTISTKRQRWCDPTRRPSSWSTPRPPTDQLLDRRPRYRRTSIWSRRALSPRRARRSSSIRSTRPWGTTRLDPVQPAARLRRLARRGADPLRARRGGSGRHGS